MRILPFIIIATLLSGCWPKSVSFKDGSMPEEWKTFYVTTLDNIAPNTPLVYAVALSEEIKTGIQNNTRLLLNTESEDAEINIEGTITNYTITPVALQEGDNASKNRLSVRVKFKIYISEPEESLMNLVSTRFIDFDSSTDLGTVEGILLQEINDQIVQDVINKLLSNW